MSAHGTTKIPRRNPLDPLGPGAGKSAFGNTTTTRRSTTTCTGHHQHPELLKGQTNKQKKSGVQATKECWGDNTKDENESIRQSLLKLEEDHQKMKKMLEGSVKDAEERLQYMKALVEKSSKQESDNSANNETGENQKIKSEEIEADNIESPEQTEEVPIEKRQKISKSKLKAMKEKLHAMNNKTQTYMDDVQVMKKELEELEAISQRLTLEREDDSDEEGDKKPKEKKTSKPLPKMDDKNSNAFFITETTT